MNRAAKILMGIVVGGFAGMVFGFIFSCFLTVCRYGVTYKESSTRVQEAQTLLLGGTALCAFIGSLVGGYMTGRSRK